MGHCGAGEIFDRIRRGDDFGPIFSLVLDISNDSQNISRVSQISCIIFSFFFLNYNFLINFFQFF